MTANTGLKDRISRWAFAVGRDSRGYRLSGLPMPGSLALKYRVGSSAGHVGGLRPRPTAIPAPTSERTMEWQKASAATSRVTSPASPPESPTATRRHSRQRRVRMIVAPARGLQ